MDNLDVFRRQIEALRHNLRECGFMPLPMAVRAGEDLYGAHGIDPNLSTFPKTNARSQASNRSRRRDAAGFNIVGIAHPSQLTAAGRFSFSCGKTCHICGGLGLLQIGFKIAAIIGHDHRGLMREAAHEVLCAQHRRVHAHFTRRCFHDAFNHIAGLWTPGPAVGIHGYGIGVNRLNITIDICNVILT